MSEDDLGTWGKRAWGALEVLHVTGYFSRECREEYKALGVRPSLAYFAARSAAMGQVPAAVVEATFYVFAGSLVSLAVPSTWSVTTPSDLLAARHRGVTATLGSLLPDRPGELDQAVALARTACEGLSAPGRPLYAAHTALPWPSDPLLALWHAATLLREHRGDGHVAVLAASGIGPVEAMITSALAGGTSLGFQRATRGWDDAAWDAGAAGLREQGLLTGEAPAEWALTDEGRELRAEVEAATDAAALAGWAHLGVEGTRRLAELAKPWRDAVLASGLLAPTRA
jgi:hypothetical protein